MPTLPTPQPIDVQFPVQKRPNYSRLVDMMGVMGMVVGKGNMQSYNYVSGSAGWKITADGTIEAYSGVFAGSISASTIDIGGADATSFHVDIDGNMWLGAATFGAAVFSVSNAGALTASSVTITGGSIGGSTTVGVGNVNIAARGWTQTSAFSASDADTVAWGSGTFTSADGTSYSINASNTGNMTSATYIYLDTAVSTTDYQTSTTATDAVGAGKVLIAKAEDGTGEATFQVFGGIGGQKIDAANSVVANSITANELATSITYAGAIIVDTSGHIRSGQTAFNTGTGWFLGNDGGTPKFSVGNPSGNYMYWDGTDLVINGYAQTSQGTFGGDGSAGALTITTGTTTVDLENEKVKVLNYSSISITGDGQLGFENPHATGSIIIIKCRGDCTLTSSDTAMINLVGMGAPGGDGGASGGNSGSGGTTSVGLWSPTFNPGGGATYNAGGTDSGASGGTAASAADIEAWVVGTGNEYKMHRRSLFLTPGSGGGGGSGSQSSAVLNASAGGRGGYGGGVLMMEVVGSLNFTTGGIDVSGEDGVAGSTATGGGTGSSHAGGGGGGGSAGMALILANTITASSGTVTCSGGNGGAGGGTAGTGDNNGSPGSGAGGGGAAGYGGAGGAGADGVTAGGADVNGSAGSTGGGVGAGGGGGSGGASDLNGAHSASGGSGGTGGSDVSCFVLVNTFF